MVALIAATGMVVAAPMVARASTVPSHVTTTRACAEPLHPGGPVCFSLVRTDIRALHADALAPDQAPGGYGPSDLRSAYNLTAASTSAGGGQTVAVMENADDPNL